MADFDLAIIGGGINGTGIARDAAGRGLSVVLFEQNDLASGTSSASSKLVHGGLRYLEHGEFRLVREALAEREVLLRMAPHLIQPLRFVLPLQEGGRSPTMLRFGLLLYDWIGGRNILPGTRALDLITDAAGQPLKRRFHDGYEYSDCLADDARLVVLNAVDAAERGAVIRTRTRCVRAERSDEWRLILNAHGQRDVVTARVLVNAAGPWVGPVAETIVRQPMEGQVRLDMGSHIVVRRLYDHDRAYLLQAADRRIVFTIPFERDFTLIGTTDRGFAGDPAAVAPDGEDINYLCTVVNDYFRTPIGAVDTVWAYAGVRALYDDGARKAQDVGREYVLKLDEQLPRGAAPDGLRRQDHDLPASCRSCAVTPRPFLPALAALDRKDAAARRRFRLRWRRDAGRADTKDLAVSERGLRPPPRAHVWHPYRPRDRNGGEAR